MPAPVRVPSDTHALELALLFAQAERRLLISLEPAIAVRAPGTAARNKLLLAQVRAVLVGLKRDAAPLAARAALTAWSAGVDLAGGPVEGSLGPAPNLAAADAVARAIQDPLDDAIRTVGRNTVDVFRQAGLEGAGRAVLTGETRVQTAAQIQADLRQQGITGFVDRAGRRWRLSAYSAMVARTVTREAVTAGFVRTYLDRGGDLIQISDHDCDTDICSPYEGRTFSLTGATPGYPQITRLPPFHPQCRHVAHPSLQARDESQRRLDSARTLEELEALLGLPAWREPARART